MDMLHSAFSLAESLLGKSIHESCEDGQHAPESTNIASLFNEPNIFRRDVCTDAFGAGWLTNTCTPGNTLCCSPRRYRKHRVLV